MDKRKFIKTGILGAAGIVSLPTLANRNNRKKVSQEFTLPGLSYSYDALEPYIDKETMLIHHTKHHAGYTANLNKALKNDGLEFNTVRELLQNISKYSDTLRNNGGGYLNHKLFWKFLSPKGGGTPSGKIGEAITKQFGSADAFMEKFGVAAKTRFGSGWAWLISNKGELKVTSTANQDSPFMDILPEDERGYPILCLDVWEHAYYLKYQNRRGDYVDAFWNLVNWEKVNERFEKSLTL
jgi:Fe-Mn family superoxide dismutase